MSRKGNKYYYKNKLIIEEINLKGKKKERIYYGDQVFDREYYNGYKWNGIFSEYFLDKLVFKAEYINGKMNGKGIEYDINGEIVFEGEYFNGEKDKGIEYNINGQKIFEGEYFNGKRWNGKMERI